MDEQARTDDAFKTADTAPAPVSRVRPWNAVNRPFYYDPTFWVSSGVVLLFVCFSEYRAQMRVPVRLFLLAYVVYLVVQTVRESQYQKNRARWARLADEEAAARESKGA